jgi:hypothetical protein
MLTVAQYNSSLGVNAILFPCIGMVLEPKNIMFI